MIINQYLWATQKYQSGGSYHPLICSMFHNLQWKKSCTDSTRDFFPLCTCTHRCWALQWSNIVTTAAIGAKFKGAMDDASPRYACQTWLPCLGWLNVILRLCLWQLTSTSLPDEISTGAADPSCYDTSKGWHGHRPEAVAAWAAPTSVFACATCHRSCATASPRHYDRSSNWTGEFSWVKNNVFFCWAIFNSDQFHDPGHHVAAGIVVPGCASMFVGWKEVAGGGREKAWVCGEPTRTLLRSSEQAWCVSSHRVCSQRGSQKALCCVVKTPGQHPRWGVLSCWFVVWESWKEEPLKPTGSRTNYLVTSFISCFVHVVHMGFVESW